jgi:hypothetical protein
VLRGWPTVRRFLHASPFVATREGDLYRSVRTDYRE